MQLFIGIVEASGQSGRIGRFQRARIAGVGTAESRRGVDGRLGLEYFADGTTVARLFVLSQRRDALDVPRRRRRRLRRCRRPSCRSFRR